MSFNPAEVARAFDVALTSVHYWIKRGWLQATPPHEEGRPHWRIRRANLRRALASQVAVAKAAMMAEAGK